MSASRPGTSGGSPGAGGGVYRSNSPPWVPPGVLPPASPKPYATPLTGTKRNKAVDGQLPIINYFEYRGFDPKYLKWLLYNTDITPSLRERLLIKAKEYVQYYPLIKITFIQTNISFFSLK